jgi:hypothetical protein
VVDPSGSERITELILQRDGVAGEEQGVDVVREGDGGVAEFADTVA